MVPLEKSIHAGPHPRRRGLSVAPRRWWRLAAGVLLAWVAAGPVGPILAQGGRTTSPNEAVQSFYRVLLEAMKEGPALGFAGRQRMLAPVIERVFDLPFMTRLVVGPPWRDITVPEQKQLVAAFTAFSIATYANQFSAYGGERFVVSPGTTPGPAGAVIVRSRLIPAHGDTVELDYLMHRRAGHWQVMDVYLTGAISQLAARRSEFATTLRTGGAPALIKLLNGKTAALGR